MTEEERLIHLCDSIASYSIMDDFVEDFIIDIINDIYPGRLHKIWDFQFIIGIPNTVWNTYIHLDYSIDGKHRISISFDNDDDYQHECILVDNDVYNPQNKVGEMAELLTRTRLSDSKILHRIETYPVDENSNSPSCLSDYEDLIFSMTSNQIDKYSRKMIELTKRLITAGDELTLPSVVKRLEQIPNLKHTYTLEQLQSICEKEESKNRK